MGIGQRIREFRTMKNMSQAELAFKANTEPSTISRWETDKGKPSASSLRKLANALEVSIGSIIEDDESYEELSNGVNDFTMPDKHSLESIITSGIILERVEGVEGDNKTRIIIPHSKEMFEKAKEVLALFYDNPKEKNQKNSKT